MNVNTDKPLVFDQPKVGHFRRGAETIAQVLGGEVCLKFVSVRVCARLVFHRGPLLCQTADDYVAAFTVVAFFRLLLFRRTVAITTRNRDRTSNVVWKHIVRLSLLGLVQRLPLVSVLTNIAPASEKPGEWVFDTEWWDLAVLPMPAIPVPLPPGPGATVVFLGNPGRHKGIYFFFAVAERAFQLGLPLRFVVVGDLSVIPRDLRERFSAWGGTLIPATDCDVEFVSYICEASWVWCCYHPASNKSSGIFDRTLQLRRPAIVRKGSYIDKYLRLYGAGICVEYDDVDGVLQALMDGPGKRGTEPTDWFAEYSIAQLRHYCGLERRDDLVG